MRDRIAGVAGFDVEHPVGARADLCAGGGDAGGTEGAQGGWAC